MTIQLDSVVQRVPEPVSSEIDDDLVILSVERGRYYGTEIVGNRIWALLAEFEIERSVCEQEVRAFLGQLQDEGLVQVL